MLLYVLKYKRDVPREERFTVETLEKIRVLFLLLTSQMKRDWSKKTIGATLSFNKSMAYFLTDTFTIVDRGFLLEAVSALSPRSKFHPLKLITLGSHVLEDDYSELLVVRDFTQVRFPQSNHRLRALRAVERAARHQHFISRKTAKVI